MDKSAFTPLERLTRAGLCAALIEEWGCVRNI